MPSLLRASIFFVAVTTVGCSAPLVDDVSDAGSMTEGVVLVERLVAGDGATQTNVSAKFMRLSAPVDPAMAERVVGSRLDRPAAGSCRPEAVEAAGPVASSSSGASGTRDNRNGAIELLDVGDLTLRAGTARLPLAARAFPDVGDLVSGMFYTSPDTESELPAGATYTLEGTGAGSVDRFTVDAEAPAAPEDVRLGGVTLASGVALDEGAPVAVSWRAANGRRGDLVVIDVSAESGASVRCTFPDEGSAVVPGWVLRGANLGALPAAATVSVHRVRERAFVAPGIDTGEVRFDLSVMGRILVTAAGAHP